MNNSRILSESFVALEDAGFEYPIENYDPTENYPEYPWGTVNPTANDNLVYAAIRKCFLDLGMDCENYGTQLWNPLKEIIHKGDKVLLKPNLVVSEHPDLSCIVTNPAIVRAVLDYVCIALKGTGEIIVGDAPMQRCDFNELVEKVGYNKLREFYLSKNVKIKFVDFRNFITDYSSDDVKVLKNVNGENDNFVSVDLGKMSLHCPKDNYYRRYRVTCYDYRKMRNYHNPHHHIYLIRKELLEANVVINLPKPKTHRKAGFTGALKNMVGAVVHKECLPHHIRGSVALGGDEYLKKDLFKCLRTFCYEKIDIANCCDNKHFLPLYKKMLNFFEILVGKYGRDLFSEGSWYGNDTIWRTFVDINRCLFYCDLNGKMHTQVQRRFLTIADMVIAGEKDGPVHASRKECGKIVAGYNPVAVDYLIAEIMGFDYKKIPALIGIERTMEYPLYIKNRSDIEIISYLNAKSNIDNFKVYFDFVPSPGWKNKIEKDMSK